MKLQDVLAVLGIAVVTMAFTLVAFGPGGAGADGPAATITPVIAQPQFTSEGCTFTLKTDKPTYEAGDTPGLEVKASNPTDKTVDATVWINISASAPASELSRMMPIPKVLWSHPWQVLLGPGETKTLNIASEVALPAGQNIRMMLSDQKAAVLARDLGVKDRSAAAQNEPPAESQNSQGPKP
jgi:hypothetical protein